MKRNGEKTRKIEPNDVRDWYMVSATDALKLYGSYGCPYCVSAITYLADHLDAMAIVDMSNKHIIAVMP